MPDGSFLNTAREITRPALSTQSPVLKLQAQMHRLSPLPRLLNEDEVTILEAAVDAGAVIVPRLLRDFLSGKGGSPFQFESCHIHVEDAGSAWIVEAVQKARARRDAFYASLENGPLSEVVARIRARERKAA